MRKSLGLVALAIAVLVTMLSVFIGCSNEIETPRFGSLNLSTDGMLSRTIQPSGELIAVTKYKVSGTGPDGATFTPVEKTDSPITVEGLIEGSWSITVEGLNASGTVIATKTLPVTIVSGQKTDAIFALQWIEGFGNLDVTVTWPTSVTSFVRIHGILSQGETPIETFDLLVENATISEALKTITQSFIGFATGSYDFVLTFHDSNGSRVGLPYMEQVNIYDGMTSTGTCAIPEILLPIETPVISPAGGRIAIGQQISITSASLDVAIYYTIDGTNPTVASPKYTGPFVLEKNAIVKAIALDPARFASAMASADFEVPAASPTFSVSGGTYDSPRTLTMSSTTGGAVIHYTLNGTDPTEASATYSSALAINENTTVKAIAIHDGYGNSTITSAQYLIRAGAPQFSLDDASPHRGTQSLTLTSATSGATILYTLNGDDPTTLGVSYDPEEGISLSTSTVVKAVSRKTNMVDSAVITKSYSIPPIAATPVIVPESGTYASKQSVTITTTEEDGEIRYTTNGENPTSSSTLYSEPFDVEVNTTVKAVTVKEGYWNSDVAQKSYQIQAAAPEFTPSAGSHNGAQTIAITSTTSGASIRYTTDGSSPSSASPLYSSPISVPYTTTIKAYSTKVGMADSASVTGEFVILGSSGLVLQNPTHYSVSIQLPSGWDATTVAANAGGIATAVVSPAPAQGEVTYTWYFDGLVAKNNANQVASTGSSIRFGIGPDEVLLGPGPHLLAVKVNKGSMTYSDQKLISAALPQTPYTVSFDAQGGAEPVPSSMTVIDGSAYGTLAATTRSGFTLTGWFTGPKGTGTEITAQSIVDLDADQTLYASWTPTDGYISVRLTSTTDPSDVRETILASGIYNKMMLMEMPGIPSAIRVEYSSNNMGFTMINATAVPMDLEGSFENSSGVIMLYLPVDDLLNPFPMPSAEYDIPDLFPDEGSVTYFHDFGNTADSTYNFTTYGPVGDFIVGTLVVDNVVIKKSTEDNPSVMEDLGTFRIEFEFCVKRLSNIYLNQLMYDFNGGVGGESLTMDYYPAGYEFKLQSHDKGLQKTGYIFGGWNTKADGSGITYQGEDLFVMPAYDITLYAVWRPVYTAVGPSGGYVFYDKGEYSDGWRYLEAAPSDIVLGSSDYTHIFGCYRATPNGESEPIGTATDIGTGKSNTEALVSKMVNGAYTSYESSTTTTTADYAAKLCDMHVAGGYDDWFLPSKDELDLMYQTLKVQNLGNFTNDVYWSSSEYDGIYAWYQYFLRGWQDFTNSGWNFSDNRSSGFRVRPVRAF